MGSQETKLPELSFFGPRCHWSDDEADWCGLYAHPIYYLETFIDPQRFRGTCYRAANWSVLGMTTGRGKADLTHQVNRSIKQVLGYPLVKDFRQRLSHMTAPTA